MCTLVTIPASTRRRQLQVQAIYKNVRTLGTGISGGQDNVARELVLDVQVVLLDHALLEVKVLRLHVAEVESWIWRCRNDR